MNKQTIKLVSCVILFSLILYLIISNIINSDTQTLDNRLTLEERSKYSESEVKFHRSVLSAINVSKNAVDTFQKKKETILQDKTEINALIETNKLTIEKLTFLNQTGTEQLNNLNENKTDIILLRKTKKELITEITNLRDKMIRFNNLLQNLNKRSQDNTQQISTPHSNDTINDVVKQVNQQNTKVMDVRDIALDVVNQYQQDTLSQQERERKIKFMQKRINGVTTLCGILTVVSILFIQKPKRYRIKSSNQEIPDSAKNNQSEKM